MMAELEIKIEKTCLNVLYFYLALMINVIKIFSYTSSWWLALHIRNVPVSNSKMKKFRPSMTIGMAAIVCNLRHHTSLASSHTMHVEVLQWKILLLQLKWLYFLFKVSTSILEQNCSKFPERALGHVCRRIKTHILARLCSNEVRI